MSDSSDLPPHPDPDPTDGAPSLPSGFLLRRRLIGGGFWALGSFAGSFVLSLVLSGVATRLLTPEDAGGFFLILSLVTSASMLALLGMDRAVIRFVSESLAHDHPARARSTVTTVAIVGFSSAALIILISALPPTQRALSALFPSTELGKVSLLIGLLVAARALGILRAETFRGFHDLRSASIFQGLDWYVLTTALLSAILLFGAREVSLELVLWVAIAGWIPGLLLGSLLLRYRLTQLHAGERVRPKELARMAWPVWLAGFGTVAVAHADMWVAGAILPARELALYGAAHRLTRLVGAPLTTINSIIQPTTASLYSIGQTEKLERVLRTSSTLAALPAGAILAIFVLGGRSVLSLVFGDIYAEAWSLLALVSGGYMVSVAVGPCSLLLMMSGHERANMVISLVAGVIMLGSALVLGSLFGAVGVAGGTGAGIAGKNVATWVAAKRLTGIATHVGIGAGVEGARAAFAEARRREAR